MRASLICILFGLTGQVLLADSATLDSLPIPVLKTADLEKGKGTLKPVESFQFGKATIFKIDVLIDGVATTELQIADSGKLIRIDQLVEPKSDNDGD